VEPRVSQGLSSSSSLNSEIPNCIITVSILLLDLEVCFIIIIILLFLFTSQKNIFLS